MSIGYETEIAAGSKNTLLSFRRADREASRDPRRSEADERESRIRTVFELESRQPLPEVGLRTMRAYYDYLADRLALPFRARYWDESDPLQGDCHLVTVIGLVDPRKRRPDLSTGLLCVARIGKRVLELPLAELELRGDATNSDLIEDYWFWFWNWR